MISWQGGRVKPLLAALQAKGLLQNGKMVRSQEALQAGMDSFIKRMASTKHFKWVMFASKALIENFKGGHIDIDFVRDTLKDILALQERLVTIENIQKVVAEYYRIKVADLKSKSRARSVTRPRQVAMALAKELTNKSLPEIGRAFERDHTTVLNACREVPKFREKDSSIQEDWANLIRTLSA